MKKITSDAKNLEPNPLTFSWSAALRSKPVLLRVVITSLLILLLSGFYLSLAWNKYDEVASAEALALGESLQALLPQALIVDLVQDPNRTENEKYPIIKQQLTRLQNTKNPLHFSYVLFETDGTISVLGDSRPDGAGDNGPTQILDVLREPYLEPFKTGQSTEMRHSVDGIGSWISVLVPIRDAETGNVIAVFGVDYSGTEWTSHIWIHMIPDIILTMCLLILSFSLLYAWLQHIANKALSRNLAFDEALYRGAFDQAPIGVAIMNGKYFVSHSLFGHANINQKFERIIGWSTRDLVKMTWAEITHPEDLALDLENFTQLQQGLINGYSMEKRFLKPDGSYVWVNMSISPLTGIPDKNATHLCIIEDISARKETERQLKEVERRQSVLLSHLPGMAYRCKHDRHWTMEFVSDGCLLLTGYAPESLLNNRDLSYNDVISPEYRDEIRNVWKTCLENRIPYQDEYEINTASGDRKWVMEIGQGIYDDDGGIDALEGIVLDISDRKEMENNLRYMSEHDRLTGLYNREYMEAFLEEEAAKGDSIKRAMISINLSTVSVITSNYGFHYTQALLKSIAEALKKLASADKRLFKTYENRFVFYVTGYRDKSDLLDFSREIASTLQSILLSERIGGGIGILEMDPDPEFNADRLSRRLLLASERSVTLFDRDFHPCFYDRELEAIVNREKDIRTALSGIASGNASGNAAGIASGNASGNAAGQKDAEVFLLYQPILDLRTNEICAFEALARLRTEKLGLVPPLEFIPIAERTKLIIPIGEIIMTQALQFLKYLVDNGHTTIRVAINISAIQILSPDFTDRLIQIIHETNVPPENIDLEITESVFASDYEQINSFIKRLRDIGLQIAIDDFGTGYSSLARVKELNVDCLKIDKYFIDKLLSDGPNNTIIGEIISMAHRLGHYTIAEGVEEKEQKNYLIENGCDMMQGYLIGKPLDEKTATAMFGIEPREQ